MIALVRLAGKRVAAVIVLSAAIGLVKSSTAAPGTLPTTTAAATTSTDPALDRELADIDARVARIGDFTAHFQQKKFTALLRKPLISSGVVRVKDSVIRWDTQQPEPLVLQADGKEVRMYYPKTKLMEVYPIDKRMSDLAASPLPRLERLRESFSIERLPLEEMKADAPDLLQGPNRLGLRLRPLNAFLKEHVQEVCVLLDTQNATMLCVATVDIDGDRTVMQLSDVHLNTGLKPADIELSVGKDVMVSHPMDAVGGAR